VARQGTAVRLGSAPWLLTAAVAVVGAQSLLLAPLFVHVARSPDTGPAAVGRAAGAYGLATAVSALALGPRVDRLPRRVVLRGAALGSSAGMLLSAGAQHWGWLAAGQAVAGAAAGVLLPVAYTTAGELAPADAQTRAPGRVLLGWSVAMVVAVPLAAAVGGVVGWRGALAGLAGLGLVLVGLLGRLPEPRTARPAGTGGGYAPALRRPGVRPLLLVVLAYMGAFYATYAYLGHHIRSEEGAGRPRPVWWPWPTAWASAPRGCSTAGSTASARLACWSRPCSHWSPSTAWCRRPPDRCRPCWCWPWRGGWSTTSG
jgi:predicted MFS family arabinose efflux permease